jgi:hypothetical protein
VLITRLSRTGAVCAALRRPWAARSEAAITIAEMNRIEMRRQVHIIDLLGLRVSSGRER